MFSESKRQRGCRHAFACKITAQLRRLKKIIATPHRVKATEVSILHLSLCSMYSVFIISHSFVSKKIYCNIYL